MDEQTLFIRVLSKITKYSIYAAIFLAPIFFLPWTSDVLDFNKQTIILFFVFLSFFSWILKVLLTGVFVINKNSINISVAVLFLVYLCSTIFSVFSKGSFWGWPQSIPESMISYICFAVFYFLISNVFSKEDIFCSLKYLFSSALIAELFGLLQIFGFFIFSFDFAKNFAFNTIGSIGSLGLFAVILLPLAIIMLIISKKWWKVIFVLEIIFSAVILFLINYQFLWLLVFAGCAMLLIFASVKRNLFEAKWMAIPMFFMVVALFFVIIRPQINLTPQKPNEIMLSWQMGSQIALGAIKENPILGSGPGTFAYDFSKFKNPEFNKTSLWNVSFNRASSEFINNVSEIGILGTFAFLALITLIFFLAFRFILSKKEILEGETRHLTLLAGFFCATAGIAVSYFLYSFNVVLFFVIFFMIGVLANLISEQKKHYELKPSSLMALIFTFVFTLVFVFGSGIIILQGQRYVAEIYYFNGISEWQANNKTAGIKSLETAANINHSSDLYFRQLSQAYLLDLQEKTKSVNANPSEEEKSAIQMLASNSINAAVLATNINPSGVNNWMLRGYIYQNMSAFADDALDWANKSYDEALLLSPNDSYLIAQKGNVVYAIALKTQDQNNKNQLLSQAKDILEKSINLNPTYSNALYSLGLVYDTLGNKAKAIDAFTKVQQLNPKDTSIPKILANLKAGFSALQTTTPPKENLPTDNAFKK